MTRIRTTLALLAVAAVAVAAVSTASAAPRQQPTNIVQTAVGAGQFKTLAALLKQAGLVGALQGKGPYTVFAPTDAAFAKVPKSTLNALAKDKALLKSVLLYHVAKGKVSSMQVVKLTSVKTLNGQKAPIRVNGGKVFAAGAQVVTPDIAASNGVIHVINKVMIPR